MSTIVVSKALKVKHRLAAARTECSELRQEVSDLQEYSTVKITRATRYLGVLADKARKLDQVGLECDTQVALMKNEQDKWSKGSLNVKGCVRVICRVRPQFETEGPVALAYPNDSTLCILPAPAGVTAIPTKVECDFDRIYGPHASQGDLFEDIKPFMDSVWNGYNMSVFVHGQRGSGKTHTLEGTKQDPGLCFRAVEGLLHHLHNNATLVPISSLHMTMFDLHDEQVSDLLIDSVNSSKDGTITMGDGDGVVELVERRINDLTDFSNILRLGKKYREKHILDGKHSGDLIVTIHICFTSVSKERQYRKMSFVDISSSRGQVPKSGVSGSGLEENLKSNQSLAGLGDVVFALTSDKETIPYGNSRLTQILADSLGGEAKVLLIINLSPCVVDLSETMSTISFVTRVCRVAGAGIYQDLERIGTDLNQVSSKDEQESFRSGEEIRQLKLSLEDANHQCGVLFDEVEKCWNANNYKVTGSQQPSFNGTLADEVSKRDELIERLHQENEKLFNRLMNPSTLEVGTKIGNKACPENRRIRDLDHDVAVSYTDRSSTENSVGVVSRREEPVSGDLVTISSDEAGRSSPAGEYLRVALMDFNPDDYESFETIGDAANRLLMLVLAAVIKAGAAREHEMLAEVRDSVFLFIKRLEHRRVLDTMLVSRVRILYIRSLLSHSPELQSIKVPCVDQFLERAGTTSRNSTTSSSSGNSPARSPVSFVLKPGLEEYIEGFKVDFRHEKRSKLSAIVLKLRGIDQQTWKQHITGGKLRETSEEARTFAIGNKALAALFVLTPAGELQRQIRAWISDNFDILSSSNADGIGKAAGHLELFSTAIMDGWMAGLGVAVLPSTDTLGQLLSDYSKLVYASQLQHLKDLAATLASEEVEDMAQVVQLRSGLESVEHKRRKVLHQMRSDVALLTKEEGGSPFINPSTANEDARIASLIALEDMLKQTEDIERQTAQKSQVEGVKDMFKRLSKISERMTTLLSIDHACAQKYIEKACGLLKSLNDQSYLGSGSRILLNEPHEDLSVPGDWEVTDDGGSIQWTVLQFNNGPSPPFVLKCGATPSLELVVKAQASTQNPSGQEIVAVVPKPSSLAGLSLEEIRKTLSGVPDTFCQLALARSADGTRARYARLYKTLIDRVPAFMS